MTGIIGAAMLLVSFGAFRFGWFTPLGRMLLNHSMEVRDKIGNKDAPKSPKTAKPSKARDTD